jgi:hypothetical protein
LCCCCCCSHCFAGANSTSLQQQQQQQALSSCQAQSSFVVWPVAERGSGLERRSSLQLPQQQQQPPGQATSAAAAAGSAGSANAAAAAAAASGAADAGLQDTEMIDYKLGMQVSKLSWEVSGAASSSAFKACYTCLVSISVDLEACQRLLVGAKSI